MARVTLAIGGGAPAPAEFVHEVYGAILFRGHRRGKDAVDPNPAHFTVEKGGEPFGVHFYHGRADTRVPLDDWGTDGPTLRVTRAVRDPRGLTLTLPSGGTLDIPLHHDCYALGACFYGDWETVA